MFVSLPTAMSSILSSIVVIFGIIPLKYVYFLLEPQSLFSLRSHFIICFALDQSVVWLTGDGAKVEYCGTCDAEVNDAEEGICCDGDCERWFHLRCSGLSQAEYDELGLDENAKWACSKCSGIKTQACFS